MSDDALVFRGVFHSYDEFPDASKYNEGDVIEHGGREYVKLQGSWYYLGTDPIKLHQSIEEQQIWKDMKGVK